jgi:pyrroloquinoline quinone biosynthesis protein B
MSKRPGRVRGNCADPPGEVIILRTDVVSVTFGCVRRLGFPDMIAVKMAIEAIVLGRAQDAGMPQAGCACPRCMAARLGSIPQEYAASLAVIDRSRNEAWLIDAGPDFREQMFELEAARPMTRLAGIFITHAHIGHYAGLIHLGREAMNVVGLPVHGTPRLCEFLRRKAHKDHITEAYGDQVEEILNETLGVRPG